MVDFGCILLSLLSNSKLLNIFNTLIVEKIVKIFLTNLKSLNFVSRVVTYYLFKHWLLKKFKLKLNNHIVPDKESVIKSNLVNTECSISIERKSFEQFY